MFFVSKAANECEQQAQQLHLNTDLQCSICYGAHHGKYCIRRLQRCFECHVRIKQKIDHAKNCGAREWYQSHKYVDLYVKIPSVRATISFGIPIAYALDGSFVDAKPGNELFSGMADVLFKFVSKSTIIIKTTGFTRIRLPVIVREKNGTFTERVIFMTSQDRTMVAANSSRIVYRPNLFNDFEHNTPLVLLLTDDFKDVSVDVNSGGKVYNCHLTPTPDGKKLKIPDDLQVKSQQFMPKLFDAELPSKKSKCQ